MAKADEEALQKAKQFVADTQRQNAEYAIKVATWPTADLELPDGYIANRIVICDAHTEAVQQGREVSLRCRADSITVFAETREDVELFCQDLTRRGVNYRRV